MDHRRRRRGKMKPRPSSSGSGAIPPPNPSLQQQPNLNPSARSFTPVAIMPPVAPSAYSPPVQHQGTSSRHATPLPHDIAIHPHPHRDTRAHIPHHSPLTSGSPPKIPPSHSGRRSLTSESAVELVYHQAKAAEAAKLMAARAHGMISSPLCSPHTTPTLPTHPLHLTSAARVSSRSRSCPFRLSLIDLLRPPSNPSFSSWPGPPF